MTEGTEAGSALSLEDYLSSALDGTGAAGDDFGDTGAPDTTTEASAAGAPPAEPPDGDTEPQSDQEGEASDVATQSGAATDTAPDSATQSSEIDPLAGAEPCTYTVNGETRTYEDIKVLKDQGGIITADALPRLQQRLAERDHLFETSQQRYKDQQALEQLTAWKTTGPDGSERTLTGREALEAQRVVLGQTVAALNVLTEAFKNPVVFSGLVSVNEQGQIVPDPTALQHLITRAELAEVNAEKAVRAHFQTLGAPAAAAQAQSGAAASSAAIALPETFVPQYAASLGVSGLTAEDTKILTSLAPRFVRTATSEDVLANPVLRVGEPVIEAQFADLVKQQGALRNTGQQTQAASAAAVKAMQENQARLQAAKTAPKPSAPAKRPAERDRDEQGRFKASDDAWAFLNS